MDLKCFDDNRDNYFQLVNNQPSPVVDFRFPDHPSPITAMCLGPVYQHELYKWRMSPQDLPFLGTFPHPEHQSSHQQVCLPMIIFCSIILILSLTNVVLLCIILFISLFNVSQFVFKKNINILFTNQGSKHCKLLSHPAAGNCLRSL